MNDLFEAGMIVVNPDKSITVSKEKSTIASSLYLNSMDGGAGANRGIRREASRAKEQIEEQNTFLISGLE